MIQNKPLALLSSSSKRTMRPPRIFEESESDTKKGKWAHMHLQRLMYIRFWLRGRHQ